MKAAVVALAAAAALVSAAPGGETSPGLPIHCAKPNASYCIAGDMILRCDGNKMGVRGRCSDNLDGYPPQGGLASCYQSSEDAGDAACQKNCVVYAAQPFTLPADKCIPSFSITHKWPTAHPTVPAGASTTAESATTETGIMGIPEGTSLGTAPHATPAPAPTFPFRNSTMKASTTTPAHHHSTPTLAPTLMTSTRGPTDTPAPQPDSTLEASAATTSALPTNAANVNQAAGVMAAAGLVAALFL
ncbi:hypothetical protein E4U42_005466 [Claviceps africana]|uniref:Uncharacterized protein n=1 Tax=Claviceps africana TaxID=83212 RepID=A0A8K0J492_9HYPO|nr:hypothetical protein E4U42_005466 [Claviceps africana]